MKDKYDITPEVKLWFHVKNPNLEDCWSEGYESAQQNLEESANPFKEGSREHGQWQEGWWAGFYEETHLYQADYQSEDQIHTEKTVTALEKTAQSAANQKIWQTEDFKKWAIRLVKVTGIVAAAAVGYQLLDIAA